MADFIVIDNPVWEVYVPGTVYQCEVHLAPEPGGGYSAVAASLPGVASRGGTEDEALRNVADALTATLLAYRDAGQQPPWAAPRPPPATRNPVRHLVVRPPGGDSPRAVNPG